MKQITPVLITLLLAAGTPHSAEAVDIQRIARDVVSVFAARGPGVEWVPGEPAETQADPELIRLLIQNLIDNAVKFSQPGSRPVAVQVRNENDRTVLRVQDDGIGFPRGAEKRVFEPFVKLDPARGHGVGYGIGLNLCQRIAQIHGGEIRLLPGKPRGTEAIVTLPG